MRIGLFDSGVGGLTVLKALKEKYPLNDYIYYGDTLNVPYGNKTKDELLKLAKKDINFLIKKNVDMIIIACGTISSNCINELKKEYSIPILSIIEPTIDYLNKSKYESIGIIATHATINSHIFKNNIKKQVYEIETPKLVPYIESNDLKNIKETLHTYLDGYIDKIDILVLGCTHYPIIKDYIKDIYNKEILDMSSLININNNGTGTIELYFSKINNDIKNNIKRILDIKKFNINN